MARLASNLTVATPEHRLICRVCEKQYSKYTCPQCNLRYCSLACYKNHSLRCTESFMRNNVMEEMLDIQSTQESQQSIVEALKRLHFDEAGRSVFEDESLIDQDVEDDDLDNSHGTVLSRKTLKLIATGGDICLDDLTVKERKAFLRAVAAGKLSNLIPLWNPWWLKPLAGNISITTHGTSLIQSLGEQRANKLRANVSERALGELPAPPSEPLSRVRQLMQVDPSPLISVFLAELIYSYCFTLRFYNGDWQSEPLEAALILLSVSQVLDQAATPESIHVAFAEAVKTICSPTLKHAGGFEFAVALFNDCSAVLRLGRGCVVCALADLHRMFESAKSDLKAEVGAEKQEMIKHQLRGRPGNLDGKSNCSSTVKLEIGPCATRKPSGEGVRERGSQRKTFAELPKMRDNERSLPENRNRLSTKGGDTHTSSKLSQSSRRTGASGSPREQKKSSLELRKITAALQKIYFLMCWTNEQPSQILSSLALLVDAEKDRLMESSVTQNSKLPSMLQEVRALVTKSGPIIEEKRAL